LVEERAAKERHFEPRKTGRKDIIITSGRRRRSGKEGRGVSLCAEGESRGRLTRRYCSKGTDGKGKIKAKRVNPHTVFMRDEKSTNIYCISGWGKRLRVRRGGE